MVLVLFLVFFWARKRERYWDGPPYPMRGLVVPIIIKTQMRSKSLKKSKGKKKKKKKQRTYCVTFVLNFPTLRNVPANTIFDVDSFTQTGIVVVVVVVF